MTLLVIACSSSANSGYSGFTDAGPGGVGTTAGDGGGSSSAGGGFGGEDASTAIPADAACASVSEQGVSTPVNLYIMFDKSSSQVGTKWDSAKAGLGAFLNDPSSAGIRAAINFFPRANDAIPVCDQPAYKAPRVPFAVLPGNAAAISAALQAETPNGFDTPIYPALGGAILGAIAEVQARPGEAGAVLLVTDGEPTGPAPLCGTVNPEDVSAISAIASSGLHYSPSIKTFVIGLPGVTPSTVNAIAAAGGTTKAYIVASTSIQADFQKALSQVRGQALPCEFELPAKLADKTYTYDRVNVAYTKAGTAAPVTLPQSADCSGDGWRYDNASDPKRITLCPATCATVKADYGAKIEILLGCATILK